MNRPLNPWKLTGYKAGQNVVCKVVKAEPGGYAVRIPKDDLPGFLPTEAKLKEGEEVLAQFVCVHNNRVLLSARMHGSTLQGTSGRYSQSSSSQNWEKHASSSHQIPVQDEQEAAFRVWAQGRPHNIRLKRAIDLIMPAITSEDITNMRIGDEDLEWLITTLEGGMRTGCVKAFCEPRKSRSAVLLFRGRAVGCIYGSKRMPPDSPTEVALQMMLSDLHEPDTNVVIYDLPEDVTLAMSALFVGYPVERTADYDARAYIEYIGSWLNQREQTACLAISPTGGGTCLAFVNCGKFCGAFYVEDQKFSTDAKTLFDLIGNDPQAQVNASILPPDVTSSSMRLGYSLSMAKKAAALQQQAQQPQQQQQGA